MVSKFIKIVFFLGLECKTCHVSRKEKLLSYNSCKIHKNDLKSKKNAQ